MTVDIRLHACALTTGGQLIIHPLDLHLPAGQTTVLLGPSGCGKTSLLRLVAGLAFADAGGRIVFSGRDVTALPIEKRNVGMVFQNYALFPHMTVAQNIGYGLKVRGLSRARQAARVAEMLEMMHLGGLGARGVGGLSGGQKQRVALARAIAVWPDVLLLDEPLSALDPTLRESLRAEIDTTLRALGTTTLYVTHDRNEAMLLADRIVVLNHGRVAQDGPPRELWARPASRFVASFLGGGIMVRAHVGAGGMDMGGTVLPAPPGIGFTGPADVLVRADNATLAPAGTPGALPVVIETVHDLGERIHVAMRLHGALFQLDLPPGLPVRPGPAALRLVPGRTIVFAA